MKTWLYYTVLLCHFLVCYSKVLQFDLKRKPIRQDRSLAAAKFKEFGFTRREGDGVYYADIRIGTPQQTFTAIVDTGSATIAVPCKGCSCGNHNHFDLSASSTGSVGHGVYRQCYSEGSCNSGQNIIDHVCLGENCSPEESVFHSFGCCSSFARAFKTQEADGIIGMSGATGTLLSDLRSHHMLERNMFSLCLGVNVGSLSVGGYSEERHLEPIQWVPLSQGSFYTIAVQGMTVNGQPVGGFTPKNPIVDSGTTFTYVPPAVHSGLKTAFNNFCGLSGKNCLGVQNPPGTNSADRRDAVYCYSKDPKLSFTEWASSFPSIEWKLSATVTICIPAQSYMFMSSTGIFCVGMLRDGRNRLVIGAISMSGFDMIFDHDQGRLGLARALCDKENTEVDANCCGSCKKARANGFTGNFGSPTMPPTPVPIITPVPTSEPFSVNGSVSVQSGAGGSTVKTLLPGQKLPVIVHSGEELHVNFSTTICTGSFPITFETGSILVISSSKTSATRVGIGSACKLDRVIVQEHSSLVVVKDEGVELGQLVSSGEVVVLESALLVASLNFSSSAKLQVVNGQIGSTSGMLMISQGTLECNNSMIRSKITATKYSTITANNCKLNDGGLITGTLGCTLSTSNCITSKTPLVLSTTSHISLDISQSGESVLNLNLEESNSSTNSKSVSVFDGEIDFDGVMDLDALGKCLKVEVANNGSLVYDVGCVEQCESTGVCVGKSNHDEDSFFAKIPRTPLFLGSSLAGILLAILILALILLPRRRHQYSQVAKQ